MAAATGVDDRSLVSHAARRRAADIAFAAVVAAVLGYGLYSVLAYLAAGQQGLAVLGQAFGFGFLTFLRVVVVVVVASVVWVPVGVWIGFNPRVAQYLQPVVQVFASFPANFIFPFAIVLFLDIGLSLNYGSILLMALGTQWYILFNVIAGASSVPSDLRGRHGQPRRARPGAMAADDPARCVPRLRHRRDHRGRRAWNASIVAEIVIYNRHVLVASGLGSYISQATAHNDFHEILAGILVMAVYVTGLNALLWRRLYSIAESKYALA